MKKTLGLSIIELLVALGIGSAGSLVFLNLMTRSSYSNIQLNQVRTAINLRNRILDSLKSPSGWSNTIALPANGMDCLDANLPVLCNQAPPVAGQPWRGFPFSPLTQDGSSPAMPADAPFTYSMYWEPICAAYPCPNKQVEVRLHGVLNVDRGLFRGVDLNPANYNIDIVRTQINNTIESACASLGGDYDAVNITCRPRYAGQSCAGNRYVKEVRADGSLVCAPAYTGVCGADQVLMGVTALGAAICGPKICDCKATVTWSPCSAACGGGTSTSTVTIISPPLNGGAPCPPPSTTVACNTQPCCAANVGQACTGNQYQTWTENIADCAAPGLCSACDYSVNRCTSAGMLSCSVPLVTCYANFDASGSYDCSGTCQIGGCGEFTGCAGNNWVHQATTCAISVLTYDSPACATCRWTDIGAGFGPCPAQPATCSSGDVQDFGVGASQGPGLWAGGCHRFRCDCN